MEKIVKILFFAFSVIIGIPLIINEAFKYSCYLTMWNAGEALNFYGLILSFGTAFVTLWQTQRQFKIETRKKVMPYFVIEKYDIKSAIDFKKYVPYLFKKKEAKGKSVQENGIDYAESVSHDFYFSLQGKKVKCENELSQIV